MRVVQITPSSGDSFYCENCLRDITLVRAMRGLGHDVIMVPLYLPLRADKGEKIESAPIFFGGINVYLQQKSALFRKTPRWIDRVFDSPGLLGWVGRKASMTSAGELGRMTVSILRGEEGRQIKELGRLVEWLCGEENKADLVCLSNLLLVGMARRIKERLGVPVVCLLQDEDGFLDGLARPYAEEAWGIVAERAGDVDAFIAVSKYYGDFVRRKLGLEADRMHVGYVGISLEGYEGRQAQPEIPTIGFLSQMCSEKGLDTLVEAFVVLKQKDGLQNARLRIAGGRSGGDEAFLKQIRGRLESCGLSDDVEFLADFDRDAKLAFLSSLSVLSVPEKKPAAYGLYVLEALAAGVPVVQPRIGVFPELLDMTGGGVLYEPNDTGEPARSIERLLLDPDRAKELGQDGRAAVLAKFDVEQTAPEIVRIYEGIIRQFPRG
ncbi:MAG: glycosyltransferase [Phycisphaerae bacterium]|nr:glycosyltransferase [Phycisphaerae bacterium]